VLTFKVPVEPKQKDKNCCSIKISFHVQKSGACVDNLHTPRNVTPSGLPSCRNFSLLMLLTELAADAESESFSFAIDVLSLKSCVMAMPIDANESDVRNHARNVRSLVLISPASPSVEETIVTYPVRDGRVQHCLCSQARRCRISRQAVSNRLLCPRRPQTLDPHCLV